MEQITLGFPGSTSKRDRGGVMVPGLTMSS
jgi:hypothetical protein